MVRTQLYTTNTPVNELPTTNLTLVNQQIMLSLPVGLKEMAGIAKQLEDMKQAMLEGNVISPFVTDITTTNTSATPPTTTATSATPPATKSNGLFQPLFFMTIRKPYTKTLNKRIKINKPRRA